MSPRDLGAEPETPAGLVHVHDDAPGWTRRKAGKGFSYRDEAGARITDREALARLRSLAIPPAWTDVWICPDPRGHIQATGRDARGRKQYRYHPDWTEARGTEKFEALPEFAEALPTVRAQVEADMRRRTLDRRKVIASVCWLLDHALVRIGNPAYARDNRSFGLTTLRDRHLEIEGSAFRLRFMGKSGREWDLRLTDRRIRRVVSACHELPGQSLFKYLEDGEPRAIGSHDVNEYLREASGASLTSRHFRTWAGTVRAAALLGAEEPPRSKTDGRRRINAALDQVSSMLGNTRAVCRSGYVHPRVLDSYAEGRLTEELASVRPARLEGLEADERRTLAWLKAARDGKL